MAPEDIIGIVAMRLINFTCEHPGCKAQADFEVEKNVPSRNLGVITVANYYCNAHLPIRAERFWDEACAK